MLLVSVPRRVSFRAPQFGLPFVDECPSNAPERREPPVGGSQVIGCEV
jgi:hypothetical protein